MTRRLLTSAVAMGVVAAACATTKKTPESAPSAIGGGAPAQHPEMFVEHFARTLEMRDAVIHGDLDRARKNARALAAYDIPANFPERWRPFIDELRAAAKAGDEADTLDRAGVAVARIASTCGDCHRALGGPTFQIGEPPAMAATDTAAQMRLHAWGIDRLWLGLVQPSDAAWKKGSDVIASAPLERPGTSAEENVTLVERVHALGERAQTLVGRAPPPAPPNGPRRVAVYGQLVATCAACHGMVKTE